MKVIGYIRVSTQDQAREGVSLEAQRMRIQQWAQLNEGDVTEIFEDAGISGKSMRRRPGLAAALAAADKGSALVAYSISRLARSTHDMLSIASQLERQGADLVSLSEKIDTTTAAGRMVFRMLAVLAEFERDVISERTKMGLAVLKARGVTLGSPAPSKGGQVTAASRRAAAAARDAPILAAMTLGTLRERAERLNAAGYRTTHGKPLTASALSRMLARKSP